MKHIKRITGILLFGIILFVSYTTVDAAEVTQSAQTDKSITININGLSERLTGWKATLQQYDDSYTNKIDIQTSEQLGANIKEYTFSNLTPGTEYYVKVDYTYKDFSDIEDSDSVSKTIYTAPGKVTGVNQVQWWYYIENVDFSWDKQDACSYEWVAYQGNKQVANSTDISRSNSGSFSVKNNKLYTVKVRAFTTINDQVIYGDWSDTAYLFTQPMINSNKGITIDNSGKMKVKWEKIDGVTGYDVYVSTKEKSGYKKVASVNAKKGSITIKKFNKKKFNKKKTYYVYVVAKKNVDGTIYTSGRLYSTQYKKGSNTLRWSFSTN